MIQFIFLTESQGKLAEGAVESCWWRPSNMAVSAFLLDLSFLSPSNVKKVVNFKDVWLNFTTNFTEFILP